MQYRKLNPVPPAATSRCRTNLHSRGVVAALLVLTGLLACGGAQAQKAVIVFAGVHTDPTYVAQHASWIESRPFDGLVINDYLGRNLLNTRLQADAPATLEPNSGAVSYEAAARGLAPLKGAFKKFRYNFSKVNFNMVGAPPPLNDDKGWATAVQSAANYARAVRDTGLKGIFFDNETYLHPSLNGKAHADYWQYEDQVGFAGKSPSALSVADAVSLARTRGQALMQAFMRGYPGITVIVAHGPQEGCDAWRRRTGHFGGDHYLLGAFVAGMIQGTAGGATLVDGGEDYDLRSARDFSLAHDWRAGLDPEGITNVGAGRCPFMGNALASIWRSKSSIAFSTFDKERASLSSNDWTPISDVGSFRATLTNALNATDEYVWHYSQWQDWWGDSMEGALQPWVDAIKAARHAAGLPQ
jgi:hypothetical protein